MHDIHPQNIVYMLLDFFKNILIQIQQDFIE